MEWLTGINWGFVIANATVLACIYGTLAIGLSITWSSLGLINMAYGFIFAFAGYGAWEMAQFLAGFGLKSGFLVSALVFAAGILAGAIGGIITCAIAFIPMHDKPNFVVRGMIATLAISLMGNQALMWWYGARNKNLPAIFGNGKVEFLGIVMTSDKIGAVVASIVLLTAVLLWMKSSRRGLEIRAMMMNPAAASIVGIGIRRTAFSVMALTGGLAGLASVLLSQVYYVAPFSGITPMVKGLSVALCGGLGSVAGAVIAAVVLGISEALTSVTVGGRYILMTQFGIIILILLWRPRGIAGILDKAREA